MDSAQISSLQREDRAECARLLAESFGDGDRERRARFLSRVAADVRVLRMDERVCALAVVRDRQAALGGRFVPAVCLSSVCVDPALRGRGIGSRLVRGLLQSAHERGVGLALLTTADTRFWKRAGFVVGGVRSQGSLELGSGALARGGLAAGTSLVRSPSIATLLSAPTVLDTPICSGSILRPRERSDERVVAALARDSARRGSGLVPLTRHDRRRHSRPPRASYVLEREGELVGAFTLSVHRTDATETHFVHEFLALDAAAARELWRSIGTPGRSGALVRWRGSAQDADAHPSPDARYSELDTWMARLVDIRVAFARRGYAARCADNFEFDVQADVLTAQQDPFTLTLRDGRARVSVGGGGRIRCDVEAATRLFLGSANAAALYDAGKIRGERADIQHLQAAFACVAPSLPYLP